MKDNIGDRMKGFYENRTQTNLMRRMYTIIRCDGKSFSNYTKCLKRPFDDGLIADMNATTIALCQGIQGAKLGYVQSDEISIVLTDFDTLKSDAWFDGNVQKMVSISASIATAEFNRFRLKRNLSILEDILGFRMATFDARVFQLPTRDEVINYLLWRQKDATRNSISSVAQSLYSHNELNKKSSNEKQEMIFQKGINWDKFTSREKRGGLIQKNSYINGEMGTIFNTDLGTGVDQTFYNVPSLKDNAILLPSDAVVRTKWEIVECPNIAQDRNYLKRILQENL
jgi:tRNA(His) guanylyltransferase